MLFCLLSIYSCNDNNDNNDNNDDNETTGADYKVLGITKVSVNDEQIEVYDSGLLNITSIDSIGLIGTTSSEATKHAKFNYIIATKKDTVLIDVKSTYSDATTVITSQKENNKISIDAVITRNGYDEQITYNFSAVLSD